MAEERCDDCGYWIRAHLTRDGKFIGCPLTLAKSIGRADSLPRITVRVGKSGSRRDRILVLWPDMRDADSGQIVVWDLTTGDHYVDDQLQVQRNTRRAKKDQEKDVQAEIEYQLGGAVRVVNSAHGKGG